VNRNYTKFSGNSFYSFGDENSGKYDLLIVRSFHAHCEKYAWESSFCCWRHYSLCNFRCSETNNKHTAVGLASSIWTSCISYPASFTASIKHDCRVMSTKWGSLWPADEPYSMIYFAFVLSHSKHMLAFLCVYDPTTISHVLLQLLRSCHGMSETLCGNS